MIYNIYTDGACSGNPGKGGWAFIALNDKDKIIKEKRGKAEYTTNNQMELTAFLHALEWFDAHKENNQVQIHTDSAYIYNCFNDMWYPRWFANNWTNANKKPVANKELWQQIFALYIPSTEKIEIVKVAGHTGNKWNEYVDNLAVKGTKEQGAKK